MFVVTVVTVRNRRPHTCDDGNTRDDAGSAVSSVTSATQQRELMQADPVFKYVGYGLLGDIYDSYRLQNRNIMKNNLKI